MVTMQPITDYRTMEEVYKDFELFINSSKYCVRIDEKHQRIAIDDSNKFEALISYVENFMFAVEDLLNSGVECFAITLDSIRKEMESEFCVPTKRQFMAVIATIKAELREQFQIIESSNLITFSRMP